LDNKKTTKELVLELLEENGTSFLSGEDIAGRLFVTRAAVWKAIKSLKEKGYNIEAVTNKGYRLVKSGKLPDVCVIKKAVEEEKTDLFGDREIIIYETVASTNDTARDFALTNPGVEAVFISNAQTKGRGRRGRDFFSPAGTGMYMSFLIYPNVSINEAMNYTCMMAECICRAINKVTGLEPQIKWVNDIYYNDRKISGILTEAITSLEDGELSYVIIGAGINLYQPYDGFPDEIKKTAGALFTQEEGNYVRDEMYGKIISEFYKCYKEPEKHPFIEGYKNRSMLIGNYVKVLSHKEKDENSRGNNYALVTGIDDDCHLLIRYENGKEDVLFSGEVSVIKY